MALKVNRVFPSFPGVVRQRSARCMRRWRAMDYTASTVTCTRKAPTFLEDWDPSDTSQRSVEISSQKYFIVFQWFLKCALKNSRHLHTYLLMYIHTYVYILYTCVQSPIVPLWLYLATCCGYVWSLCRGTVRTFLLPDLRPLLPIIVLMFCWSFAL